MAFTPRTWTARDVQYPGRVVLTPTGNTNEYDTTRSEGNIITEGDILSAELMNDFENRVKVGFDGTCPIPISGSFTPYMVGSSTAGAPTHTVQTGSYYKIGKLIVIKGHIAISSKGGMVGTALIKGLPAAAPASPGGAINFFYTSGYSITGSLQGEIEYDFLAIHRAAQTECNAVLASDLTDSFAAYFVGYYIAS